MAWSIVLLQKLIVPISSNASHCIEPAVFTKARLLFLSLCRLMQSTPFCPVVLRCLLLLATVELCLWPRGLRHGFAVACLLKLRVLIVLGHGCVFCEYCLCCRVKVSAMGRSPFQRSPSECAVSECDYETATMRKPRPTRAVELWKKKKNEISASHKPYGLATSCFW